MTLPESQACPNGYSLSYSNGDGGNPAGGAYCGLEPFVGDPGQVASLSEVNLLTFSTSHYWNRHLGCYVHNTYASQQWNDQIFLDFLPHPDKPTVLKISTEYTGLIPPTVMDTIGVPTQWAYRVALIESTPGVLVTTNLYNVGTSFLTPRRIDCPKSPTYP